MSGIKSNGSTASYYELPEEAKELQHLISYKNMNAQVGEAFRGLYRLGESSHSDRIRDLKKVIFYCDAELERIDKYESSTKPSIRSFADPTLYGKSCTQEFTPVVEATGKKFLEDAYDEEDNPFDINDLTGGECEHLNLQCDDSDDYYEE